MTPCIDYCNKCPRYNSRKHAHADCTHYKVSDDGSCSRDFKLFPMGWTVNRMNDFTGIEGGDDFGLYGVI